MTINQAEACCLDWASANHRQLCRNFLRFDVRVHRLAGGPQPQLVVSFSASEWYHPDLVRTYLAHEYEAMSYDALFELLAAYCGDARKYFTEAALEEARSRLRTVFTTRLAGQS